MLTIYTDKHFSVFLLIITADVCTSVDLNVYVCFCRQNWSALGAKMYPPRTDFGSQNWSSLDKTSAPRPVLVTKVDLGCYILAAKIGPPTLILAATIGPL